MHNVKDTILKSLLFITMFFLWSCAGSGAIEKTSASEKGESYQMIQEEKQLLFQKFFQASNQGGRKGTGLGLFISKGIVEAHGGKIWVEDNEPKGTKMIFQIPINTN